MTEQEETVVNEQQDEITIAEEANKVMRKKDEEIAKLKRELAQAKLYSTADEDDEEPLSREECIKRLGDSRTSNYDYAEAVCGLVDAELAEGRRNPLGKNGDEVYKFFKDVLEECDGDKSRFTSIYQSRLGPDDPSVAMAYNKRKH